MKSLFTKANEIVAARSVWEQKQRLYYQMRHDGLRRRDKPFPRAADMHFPLIDMNIGKAKPFWEAQATSSERLASFVALQAQEKATTTAVADYYDFVLRQESNFEAELIRAIDFMCLRGRGVLSAVVDPFDEYKLVFEGIDPIFILMCDGADDFEDADYFVRVEHLSVARYRRNRRFNQHETVINSIRGNADFDGTLNEVQLKEAREGVNFSRRQDQVILWNHYERTMGGWTVHTYSPQDPEAAVRKPFGLPYKTRGKVSLPFFSFKTEIKDKGWYSPRGLAELNAPFEKYICKLWNEKTDAMTFGNRPVFTSENQIPNTANIRWNPGEFIPGNIKAVQMAQPAFSFDQEMASARSISEQRSRLPDFGITQPDTPGGPGKPRTATENNRISNLQDVGTESSGRIFLMDLAKVHRHVWGLLLQFKRKEMAYFVSGEMKTVPEQALHDAYLIRPDGQPDQWNRQMRQQRADQRWAKFRGAQNVDQDGLVRDSLAADDPKCALELFIATNVKAGSEAEDEAVEIGIMILGFPAEVKPDEDHVTRIHVLLGWLQKQALTGAPPDPVALQRVQGHLVQHFQYLQKMQPQAAHQVLQQIEQVEKQSAPSFAGATEGRPMGSQAAGPTGNPS